MKNNFFQRKCLICKTHKTKQEFIRFYIYDSKLFIDELNNKLFRGYYVCNNFDEVNKFLKRYQHSKSDIKIHESVFEIINKLF